MQFNAPAIKRLGLPEYNWWNECLHGVGRAGIATVFPQALGLAATWNTSLISQVTDVISDEAGVKHHEALRKGKREIYAGLTFWSPNINIFRDPRWGRGQETYGECPYLTSRMGVAFVRGLQGLEGEEMPIDLEGFNGGDRTDIKLPSTQENLIKAIHNTGKPVILVLLAGSTLAVNWADVNLPAIINAWYPGQSGGDAIADALFGDYNPGGRLLVTFYKSINDITPFEDYNMEGHTYRFFRGEPLYPFGYGLSYTKFKYSNIHCKIESILPGQEIKIKVDVKNTGKIAGDEIVQIYLRDFQASYPVPIRNLVGFKRIHLDPCETQTLGFTITPRQMSLVNDAGDRIIEPGEFQITAGGRQPDKDSPLH